MKKTILIGFSLVVLVGCFAIPSIEVEIPETEIKITFDKIMVSNRLMINLLEMGNETRVFDEIFSDTLKSNKSLDQFKEELHSLTVKYGKLLPSPFSHGRELTHPSEATMFTLEEPIRVRSLYEFERRTIYVTLFFIGPEEDLKLGKYVFNEN